MKKFFLWFLLCQLAYIAYGQKPAVVSQPQHYIKKIQFDSLQFNGVNGAISGFPFKMIGDSTTGTDYVTHNALNDSLANLNLYVTTVFTGDGTAANKLGINLDTLFNLNQDLYIHQNGNKFRVDSVFSITSNNIAFLSAGVLGFSDLSTLSHYFSNRWFGAPLTDTLNKRIQWQWKSDSTYVTGVNPITVAQLERHNGILQAVQPPSNGKDVVNLDYFNSKAVLSGPLTGNVTIGDLSSSKYSYSIENTSTTGPNQYSVYYIQDPNGTIAQRGVTIGAEDFFAPSYDNLSVTPTSVGINILNDNTGYPSEVGQFDFYLTGFDMFNTHGGGDAVGTGFASNSTIGGIRVSDVLYGAGLGYYADYSSQGVTTFGNRWIPDKGYNDAHYAPSSGGGYAPAFTVSSPITYSSNVIGIQTASGSQAGALSSTDWATFNNKLSTATAASTYQTLANLETSLTNSSTLYPSGSAVISYLGSQSINLATGTTGTDVNWSASTVGLGGTATINIPDASATARGLVNTSAQTWNGNKTFNGTIIGGNSASNTVAYGTPGSTNFSSINTNIGATTSALYTINGHAGMNYRTLFGGSVSSIALTSGYDYANVIAGNSAVTTAATGHNYYVGGMIVRMPVITSGGATVDTTFSLAVRYNKNTIGTLNPSLLVQGGDTWLGGTLHVTNLPEGTAGTDSLAVHVASTNQIKLISSTYYATASSVPTAANPTASLGLSAVNGSATTYMRSDAAPALDQTIAPTWTGIHTWSQALAASANADAEIIQNQTTALTGNNTYNSPYLHFKTNGFASTGGTSQATEARLFLQSNQGTTSPSANFLLNFLINGSAGNATYSFGSGGVTTFTSAQLNITRSGQAATTFEDLISNETTAATSGVPVQWSPSWSQRGTVWNTSGTPASNTFAFALESRAVSSSAPIATMYWKGYVGASSTPTYNDIMSLDHLGNLKLLTGGLFLHEYTVSGLPSASSSTDMFAIVTDANSPSWGATVLGSGSTHALVMSNGTNWVVQ